MDENKVAGIEIKKLHKVYTRGNNHALKGLQVTFFKDEITAFLGHNGAGKSTTMHLLTGLYKPTAGTALIDGLDLKSHLSKIRKSLGMPDNRDGLKECELCDNSEFRPGVVCHSPANPDAESAAPSADPAVEAMVQQITTQIMAKMKG